MALLPANSATGLDAALTTAAEVQWSVDASVESTELRTPLPGTPKLKAATVAAPTVKSNNGALTSPGASGAKTITHWRYADATHNALTTWNLCDTPIPLILNGTITVADAALKEQIAPDNDLNVDSA